MRRAIFALAANREACAHPRHHAIFSTKSKQRALNRCGERDTNTLLTAPQVCYVSNRDVNVNEVKQIKPGTLTLGKEGFFMPPMLTYMCHHQQPAEAAGSQAQTIYPQVRCI